MGVLVDNVQNVVEYFSGKWWHILQIGRGGNSAIHTGIAWPCDGPHDDTGPMAALIAAATDGEAAFVDALGDMTTQTGGPFPNVSPAGWFNGLSESRQAAVVAQCVAWADAGKCP
jgi:hypothetical protein